MYSRDLEDCINCGNVKRMEPLKTQFAFSPGNYRDYRVPPASPVSPGISPVFMASPSTPRTPITSSQCKLYPPTNSPHLPKRFNGSPLTSVLLPRINFHNLPQSIPQIFKKSDETDCSKKADFPGQGRFQETNNNADPGRVDKEADYRLEVERFHNLLHVEESYIVFRKLAYAVHGRYTCLTKFTPQGIKMEYCILGFKFCIYPVLLRTRQGFRMEFKIRRFTKNSFTVTASEGKIAVVAFYCGIKKMLNIYFSSLLATVDEINVEQPRKGTISIELPC